MMGGNLKILPKDFCNSALHGTVWNVIFFFFKVTVLESSISLEGYEEDKWQL